MGSGTDRELSNIDPSRLEPRRETRLCPRQPPKTAAASISYIKWYFRAESGQPRHTLSERSPEQ